jgi:Zn-dependent oligopeptidase
MEMWVMNDGFLQRLAQLSQKDEDEIHVFEQETLDTLRNDLRKQKALDLMDGIFRGSLELSVLTEFDPRGDETLAALQARYAQEFALHDLPDKSDLSPLVSVIGENATKDGTIRAYESVYSSILAAMVYERFDKVDLTDREEVKRLGHGIRDLFYREEQVTTKDIVDLCGKDDVTVQDLRSVYKF